MNIPYWRLPNDDETMTAIGRIEHAMAERRIVRVSFLKEVRVDGRAVWFADRESPETAPLMAAMFGHRKMLTAAPVRRTIEPVMWDLNADGEPYMRGICHDAPGAEHPELRTIRLDRVIVARSGLQLTVTRRGFIVEGTGLDPQRRLTCA